MALVTMGLSPSFLRRTAFGADLMRGAALNGAARGKTLICLFQRGAADALNMVVPHGEAAYYRLRPNIAIARRVSAASPFGTLSTTSRVAGLRTSVVAPLAALTRSPLMNI